MNSEPTQSELEDCVRESIRWLKVLPQTKNAKIVVVGGLALWRLIPNFRGTKDADIWVDTIGAPKTIKENLLKLHDAPFKKNADFFYYTHPNGKWIQVDFVPDDGINRGLQLAATKITSLSGTNIPWLGRKDAVISKLFASPQRAHAAKGRQDALDAEDLLKRVDPSQPLQLTSDDEKLVRDFLDDVVKHTLNDKAWFKARLGLGPSPSSTPPQEGGHGGGAPGSLGKKPHPPKGDKSDKSGGPPPPAGPRQGGALPGQLSSNFTGSTRRSAAAPPTQSGHSTSSRTAAPPPPTKRMQCLSMEPPASRPSKSATPSRPSGHSTSTTTSAQKVPSKKPTGR